MLAEGNVFKDLYPTYAEQATTEIGGHAYVPFTPQETAKCQAALGRPCVANQEIDVGKAPAGKFNFGKTAGILQDFKVHILSVFLLSWNRWKWVVRSLIDDNCIIGSELHQDGKCETDFGALE